MFRHVVGLGSMAVLVLGGMANGADTTKDDLAKLQGKWIVTSQVSFDKEEKAKDDSDVLIFSKDMKINWSNRGFNGTFKIDATKKPKQIDWTIVEDGKKQVTQTIYQLNGDVLKVALPFDEVKKRLTSFDSKKSLVLILKRAKS